jgi:hypothetical protein
VPNVHDPDEGERICAERADKYEDEQMLAW